jgi:hypothetical protein
VASKIDDLVKAAIRAYIDASVFDWVYELKMPLGKDAALPIKVTVENWALSGWVDYSLDQKSRHGQIKLEVKGTIDESGKLDATREARVDAGWPSSEFDLFGTNDNSKTCTDKLGAKGSWPLVGTASSWGVNVGKLNLDLQWTLTVDPGSTFRCSAIENAGTPQPIQGLQPIVLTRTQ